MNVEAGPEGSLQLGDVADMGQYAQLDLAVVGADQHLSGRGDEGLPDLPPGLGADRDVLEVGIGAGQSAGRGGGQLIGRMHAVGGRIGCLCQGVGIGAFELGQLAPVEDDPRQLMGLGQGLEHGGIRAPLSGGRLLAAGQVHLAEQDLADLPRTGDVEGSAGDFMSARFQLGHSQSELGRQALQPIRIDADTGQLHLGQHAASGSATAAG